MATPEGKPATLSLRLRARRRNDDHVRHVRAEVDLAQVLEVGGRVAIDGRSRGGDVELAAVGAHHEPHAGAAVEFGLADDAPRVEVEGPELVIPDFAVDAVRPLAIGREAEADGLT